MRLTLIACLVKAVESFGRLLSEMIVGHPFAQALAARQMETNRTGIVEPKQLSARE